MVNKFVKADTYNLPKVDILDIMEFVAVSKKYSSDEIKGAKKLDSYCEGFIDLAVGRVEVRRTNGICTVKAQLLTGDRLSKPYRVTCKVDVKNDMITDASCKECKDIDGCKHSLLLLHWLQKRNSEPPPESTQCFWGRPILSPAFTEPATIEDLFPTAKRIKMGPKDPTILQKFFQECERRGLKEEDCLILKYKPKFNNS